jgi:hypothetical protein
MQNLLKTWAKNGFSIDISHTHCGSLGYKVFDGDQEIFHNNNFYASKKAMLDIDSDLIIFELIKTIEDQTKRLDDYYMSFVPEKKRNWINSERFQEFTNLIKEGV